MFNWRRAGEGGEDETKSIFRRALMFFRNFLVPLALPKLPKMPNNLIVKMKNYF
jgi:hypothetical protein